MVDGATSVTVKFEDGTTRKATVLGKDDATDIAVIKVDASGLTLHPLTLGSSASLDVGADVAAIGDPFGYARSISTGIVSGVDRTIKAPNGFTVAHAIQTDAAMNPGNSGGPVLDADGKVVGIADQIATSGNADQSSGVGFAVPIDLVKSALKTLEAGGQVKHAYLGVATGDSATAGAAISGVKNSGPAAQAGLRAGDVVTALDGTSVADSNDLVAAIAAHQPGDQVKLTVKRGSQTLHLDGDARHAVRSQPSLGDFARAPPSMAVDPNHQEDPSMLTTVRKLTVTVAALGALALGGSAIAGAADKTASPGDARPPAAARGALQHRRGEGQGGRAQEGPRRDRAAHRGRRPLQLGLPRPHQDVGRHREGRARERLVRGHGRPGRQGPRRQGPGRP